VTVPANPLPPATVIKQVPDWPGAAIEIVELEQPGLTLMPGVPTATATVFDTAALAE